MHYFICAPCVCVESCCLLEPSWAPENLGSNNNLTLPAEIGGHHAIHVDPVTQLQGYGHGEPASAQPGVGNLPGRQESITISSKPIKMKCKYTESTLAPCVKQNDRMRQAAKPCFYTLSDQSAPVFRNRYRWRQKERLALFLHKMFPLCWLEWARGASAKSGL